MTSTQPSSRGRGRGRSKAAVSSPVKASPAVSTAFESLSINTPGAQKTPPKSVGRGRGRGQKTAVVTSAPVTATSAPATSAPVTATLAPATVAPVTVASVTSASVTSAPVTAPIVATLTEPSAVVKFDAYGKIINPWTSSRKQELKPLHRKDYGTEGRPISLHTNFYEVKHTPTMKIYQYDITIALPERLLKANKSLAVDVFNTMVRDYKETYFTGIYPVFDGSKIMYTNKRIENLDKVATLPVSFKSNAVREECINIEIQPTTRVIDFSDIEAVYNNTTRDLPHNLFACADIILGFMPKMSYVNYGRNYFPRGQTVADLGDGIQLWSGSVMAVKPGQWKLLVNIDEKHTAFYKQQSLRDFMNTIFPSKVTFRTSDIKKLNDHLKGLQVQVSHNGYTRKHRVVGLMETPADKHMIRDNSTSNEMSVAVYFETVKEIKLQYPSLPCVQVEPKNREVYLPVELCSIVEGQRCIRSLTDKQIAEIIKTSAKRPDVKKRNIDFSAKKLIESSCDYVKHYGMEVSDQPLLIKGRVLQPPSLIYAEKGRQQNLVKPTHGVWRGNRLKDSKSLTKWALLSMAPQNKFNPKSFKDQLAAEGNKIGLQLHDPLVVRFISDRGFEKDVTQILSQFKELEYIFVILPSQCTNDLYSSVKRLEVAYGVVTQCINLDTYTKKFKPQTLGNILLKTNSKLGGVNWALSFNTSALGSQIGKFVFSEPVMIIGADVTHWAKDEGNKPSIAGVVCTLDRFCSRYASRIKLQVHKNNRVSDEIIRDFKEIMKELLKEFYNTCSRKPGKILYYRDGVSEGQFIQTLTEEIAGIQAACSELEEGYQPKITYITAQKRHHTRFYCANPADGDRSSGNVPAGTVVDREITHPVHFDFYLNSHCGIQGTNRPCHYTVLWDDSDMPPDMIQLLTFYLCHTYARCSRSVSYPAPTYYAHLLCARARVMLSAMRLNWYDQTNPPNLLDVERRLSQHEELKNMNYFV